MKKIEMEMAHSCCPNKLDINAPKFEKTHTTTLRSGVVMTEWKCEACSTVVMTFQLT